MRRRHKAATPPNALGLIRRLHRRYSWWDGEFIPHLAALTRQWPSGWREDVSKRRELVEAAQAYLESKQGMSEPDAAPLVPHALACAANWPYADPLAADSFSVPMGFFAGLDGFKWCQPEDDTPFLPPIYDRFFQARQDRRGGPPWVRQGRRRLQVRGRSTDPETDREAARLKDVEGWTHVRIGEHFNWPVQIGDAGSLRCRTSEQAVKRGRRIRPHLNSPT